MIGAAMNVLEFQKMKEEDARFPQAAHIDQPSTKRGN
jgi:hypothetical protein